jgi:hypothetical protein
MYIFIAINIYVAEGYFWGVYCAELHSWKKEW